MDVTPQVDQIIANYQASQMIIWITLGVILVAIIALGSEFWVNLWGVIFSPSLTLQRILGEAQWVPGLVIVLVSGMASAGITMTYFSKPAVVTALLTQMDLANNQGLAMAAEQLDGWFAQLGSDWSVSGNIDYIKEYAFQTQSVAMALPIIYLLLWFIWSLAAQLASMIAGNKAGHGLSNMISALPYLFLILILRDWFSMLDLYGTTWAKWGMYIAGLYFLFVHVILMREHGRYDIGKSIVSTIITIILIPIFIVVLAMLIAFIAVQAGNYM